jgi:hypothetical protein
MGYKMLHKVIKVLCRVLPGAAEGAAALLQVRVQAAALYSSAKHCTRTKQRCMHAQPCMQASGVSACFPDRVLLLLHPADHQEGTALHPATGFSSTTYLAIAVAFTVVFAAVAGWTLHSR